jgi:hypothetical protein
MGSPAGRRIAQSIEEQQRMLRGVPVVWGHEEVLRTSRWITRLGKSAGRPEFSFSVTIRLTVKLSRSFGLGLK